MNKAFVKEAEDRGDRCPRCGAAGQPVFAATLAAHLPAEVRNEISPTAYFCPQPSCPVAYFDRFQRTVAVDRLTTPVYPKDGSAPICPCFGLTCEDIEADVAEGVATRVRAHRQQAESPAARCAVQAANGQSCIPLVQRYFMRLRAQD